ncbi:PQQ-dependent sugar dehydrogenase [Enterobacter sichuanensis]|uniref:PQQ-dependent sugar dehydrogenase n=1 Tax=Enterobacter sichuanensis TaxID=2071710 RepID=UPI00047061D9
MPRSSLIFLPALFIPFSLLAAPEAVRVEVLQNRLDHPWSLAFLPDNNGLLVTLKGGQLKHWQAGKGLSDPIVGVPKVWANGQGGLLDVVLAPDFEQSRRIWLSYAEAGNDGKAGTAVGYGRLSDDLTRIEAFQVVFRQTPKLSTGNHFGGRLVFDGKGYLFIGLGENNQRPTAQDLDKLQGKVVRLTEDGRILGDRDQRIRDVRVGPDGYLYVLTDETDGQLLKVSPSGT